MWYDMYYRATMIEPLEPRRLLAGVTVLIHGSDGNITGWVASAANAIAQRAGGGQVSQYVMKVGKNSSNNLAVLSFTLKSGPELNKSSVAQAVVKLDWTNVDSGSFSTGQVASVVADYLMKSHGSARPLAELPLHLIGHSRGASMVVAISSVLGRRGIWVDQNTYLDPHPVRGVDIFGINIGGYGDTAMRVYSNVVFADNYWRTDGNAINFDPDGEHVSGAHEGNLNNIVQKNYVISAHMAVTAYYHGTIDLKSVFNGDHPVINSWYGTTASKPARNKTGYYFSQNVGGTRPADGLATAFGGTAARSDPGQSSTQWANATGLRVLEGRDVTAGQKFNVRFYRQDRDSTSTLTLFLDADTNPYNGNSVRTLRQVSVAKASKPTITNLGVLTSGIAPGRYYVGLKTSDTQGNTRYVYTKYLDINAPAGASPATFSNTPIAASTTITRRAVSRLVEQVQNLT
jgi:hypothetical protein